MQSVPLECSVGLTPLILHFILLQISFPPTPGSSVVSLARRKMSKSKTLTPKHFVGN